MKRRLSTRSVVVLACLGSIVADSHIKLETPKKPLPPPPPPRLLVPATNKSSLPNQDVTVISTNVDSLTQEAPRKLPPPPPPPQNDFQSEIVSTPKKPSLVPPPPIRKKENSTPDSVMDIVPSVPSWKETSTVPASGIDKTLSIPPPPRRKEESSPASSRIKEDSTRSTGATIQSKTTHEEVVEDFSLEPIPSLTVSRERENPGPEVILRTSERIEEPKEEKIEKKLKEISFVNSRPASQVLPTDASREHRPPSDFFSSGAAIVGTGPRQPPPPPPARRGEPVVHSSAPSDLQHNFSTVGETHRIPPSTTQQPQQQHQQFQNIDRPHQIPYSPPSRTQMTRNQGLQPPRYTDRWRPAPTIGTSTWKSLWNKVERGLDDLANLEETVSIRAQQLVSSVTPASILRNSQQNARLQGKTNMMQQHPPSQTRNMQTKRQTQPGITTEGLRPYGQKYEQAKENQSADESTSSLSSRQIDWNDLMDGKKMIRANGGASGPPQGALPRPPAVATTTGQSPPPQHPPRRPPPSARSSQLDPQQRNSGPVRPTNPYVPSNGLHGPPPAQLQPHARSDRIPWDTKSQAATPQQRHARPPPKGNFDREDDEDKSWKSRFAGILPPLPRLPSPAKIFRKKDPYSTYTNLDAWKAEDEDERGTGLFGFFRRRGAPMSSDSPLKLKNNQGQVKDTLAPPVANLMRRYDNGKTSSVLLDSDERHCRSIARYRATLDIVCVFFVLLGFQQLSSLNGASIEWSLSQLPSIDWSALGPWLTDSMSTWAPFAMAAAYLTTSSNKLLFENKIHSLASSVAHSVHEESQYGQLFLRLYGAVPLDNKLPLRMREATYAQVESLISASRLRWFVAFILSSLVVMTISVARPIIIAVCSALSQIFLHDGLRSWPVPWKEVASSSKAILHDLLIKLEGLIASALSNFMDSPSKFAFHVSIFVSLITVSFLPTLELRRKLQPASNDDEEDGAVGTIESAEQVARLGTSSASRLGLLSVNGSIETVLERWQVALGSSSGESVNGSISSTMRLLGYTLLAALAALLPVVVSKFFSLSPENLAASLSSTWDSLLDVSAVLLSVFFLVYNALRDAVASMDARPHMLKFLEALSQTAKEISSLRKPQSDMQFTASLSPTAGLAVNDLWAAHTTKRAWAVRGASLSCKNGEILVLLGDDSHGKTRLLTVLAESMMNPPRCALSSNKVRGSISLGGIDITKWDRNLVKRRLGVLLTDVRTVADTANLVSGLTLEEILEPVDLSKGINPSHKLSGSEKSAMLLALKITGLYSSLLPKLPSKLSTVVTANEEDLRPSLLRPRCSVLSPSEWSKLLLTKILTQSVYDNDNPAGTDDKVENCLVGSVLLLDEPTVALSEVEEGRFLKELRQTGAATILTSNKWAAGRFGDRIAVVKDGSIVETGTHNELLARGPQQSLYAAKWQAMTSL